MIVNVDLLDRDFMTEYNVAAELKIFIQDASKLDAIKEALGKLAKVNSANEEEGPFGIKILKVTLLMNDAEGGMDVLEEKIKALEGVSQLEVENVGRL